MVNLHSRGEANFDLYPYTPSASAGYAFLVFFGIGGFVHLCMLIPLRAWFFIPFVLGCAGKLPFILRFLSRMQDIVYEFSLTTP